MVGGAGAGRGKWKALETGQGVAETEHCARPSTSSSCVGGRPCCGLLFARAACALGTPQWCEMSVTQPRGGLVSADTAGLGRGLRAGTPGKLSGDACAADLLCKPQAARGQVTSITREGAGERCRMWDRPRRHDSESSRLTLPRGGA